MALGVHTLTACGVPEAIARAQLAPMSRAMRAHEITTRARARAFVATVLHESMGLRAMNEIGGGHKYEGRAAGLGNTHAGDGERFKGRGPIQLTGRGNYAAYGRMLGLDLVAHPELVATADVGWRVAACFFQHHPGVLAAADRCDFRGVTLHVNGGYNGWPDRLHYWKRLAHLGVVPGPAQLKRGARGSEVEVLTRRLSYVRSQKTGKPYLDGARATFDMSTTRALRAFQRDEGLTVNGVFDPQSAAALDREVAALKARRGTGAKAAANAVHEAHQAGHAHAGHAVHGGKAMHGRPAPAASHGGSGHARTGGSSAPTAHRPPSPQTVDRAARLWRRLELLDHESDRLRAELGAVGAPVAPPPNGAGAAPPNGAGGPPPNGAGAPPSVSPAPTGPPAELSDADLVAALERNDHEADELRRALEARVAAREAARDGDALMALVDEAERLGPRIRDAAKALVDAHAADAPAPAGTPASGSAPAIARLEAIEAEADALRTMLQQRLTGAPPVTVPSAPPSAAPAPTPVAAPPAPTHEETEHYLQLLARLDAIDIEADRVRRALRAMGAIDARGGGDPPHSAATPHAPDARTFGLRPSAMKGDDIRSWQAFLNHQLRVWKIDHEVAVDGEYGAETAMWSKRVLHGLGLSIGDWHGVTPQMRITARNPKLRNAHEVAAEHDRAEWLARVRAKYRGRKSAIDVAVAYARRHADRKTHETRTNGGPYIDDWCRMVGLTPGTPGAMWCGAFANACLVQGGLPSRTWIRYTPSIVNNARKGVEGWSWHTTPRVGDLVLFNWPSGDWVDHVGLCIAVNGDGSVRTIEGNFGNCVDYHTRKSSILGYARPPWKHAHTHA